MLTQKYLIECLSYDPTTGIFTWNKRPAHHFKNERSQRAWNAKYSGVSAGCYDKRGYLFIAVNNKLYTGHQLAFMAMVGRIPPEIDHINRVKSDNRWVNLRAVDRQTNTRNSSRRSNNASGRVGVSWSKAGSKWVAQIGVCGSTKYLGLFDDFDDAVKARVEAEMKYGFHPGHGEVLPAITTRS